MSHLQEFITNGKKNRKTKFDSMEPKAQLTF